MTDDVKRRLETVLGYHGYVRHPDILNRKKVIAAIERKVPFTQADWLLTGTFAGVSYTNWTRDDEQAVFLRYNYYRMLVAYYRDMMRRRRRVEPDTVNRLFHWLRLADAQEQLIIEHNARLAAKMVSYVRIPVDRDDPTSSDALQEAGLALGRAARLFDVSRGFRFSTYACRAVISALTRWREREIARSRVEISHDEETFPVTVDTPRDPQHGLVLEEMFAHMEEVLTPRERWVLERRYGLTTPTPQTLQQVGDDLNLTKERVRQIEAQALGKLRTALLPDEYPPEPGPEAESDGPGPGPDTSELEEFDDDIASEIEQER